MFASLVVASGEGLILRTPCSAISGTSLPHPDVFLCVLSCLKQQTRVISPFRRLTNQVASLLPSSASRSLMSLRSNELARSAVPRPHWVWITRFHTQSRGCWQALLLPGCLLAGGSVPHHIGLSVVLFTTWQLASPRVTGP